MQERHDIIAFLLERCDQKNALIAKLQAELAALKTPAPDKT